MTRIRTGGLRRRDYFAAATRIAETSPMWLRALISHIERGGDSYMTPHHIRLCKLALRRAGADYQKEPKP
ncbi:MAG: hypothetical protein LC676_10875 [Loktanella sp.]|nr:hypothetical protein [Loktanella sp.]